MAPHATRALADVSALPSATAVLVLLPDEFDAAEVISRVTSVRAIRPHLLIVVVTSNARQLRPALDPNGRSILPVVLARPTFSWTIIDAIRARGHAGTR